MCGVHVCVCVAAAAAGQIACSSQLGRRLAEGGQGAGEETTKMHAGPAPAGRPGLPSALRGGGMLPLHDTIIIISAGHARCRCCCRRSCCRCRSCVRGAPTSTRCEAALHRTAPQYTPPRPALLALPGTRRAQEAAPAPVPPAAAAARLSVHVLCLAALWCHGHGVHKEGLDRGYGHEHVRDEHHLQDGACSGGCVAMWDEGIPKQQRLGANCTGHSGHTGGGWAPRMHAYPACVRARTACACSWGPGPRPGPSLSPYLTAPGPAPHAHHLPPPCPHPRLLRPSSTFEGLTSYTPPKKALGHQTLNPTCCRPLRYLEALGGVGWREGEDKPDGKQGGG